MADVSPSYLSRGGSNPSLNAPTSPYPTHPPPHILATSTRPHSLGSQPVAGCSGPSRGSYDDNWSPSAPKTVPECSYATLENARYTPNGYPRADHDNEDRHFEFDGRGYQVLGVFDGHDGGRASGFASNYMRELFDMDSWKKVVEDTSQDMVPMVLTEFFKTTDREFFKSIEQDIGWKEAYTAVIPEGMTSYQAQQHYPEEVAVLQQVEPRIVGGTTAVLAIIANNKLYVANVGDSRAILVYEKPDKTLAVEQLSVDHGVENEDEVKRLEALGLNRENLKKAGRLGTQENTRSIGDYYIKRGYKNVDSLVSARGEPGIAIPHITEGRPIDDSFRYLILMTDGVYKSIEGTFDDENVIDSNKVLADMIENTASKGRSFTRVADNVLDRLAQIHHDSYQRAAIKDVRSPKAVNCRKRDDMTCIVYKFPQQQTQPASNSHLSHIHGKYPSSAPSSLQTT